MYIMFCPWKYEKNEETNSRIRVFKCSLLINWIWHWVCDKGLQSTVVFLLKNQFKSLCQIYIYKFIPPLATKLHIGTHKVD